MNEQIEVTRRLLRYDPETGKLYWRERTARDFRQVFRPPSDKYVRAWNNRYAGKEALIATTRDGYRAGKIQDRFYRAHRIAWLIHYGEWPKHEVDHINGDPADNRIVNLRDVPHAENGRNRAVSRDNKSGVNGVHRNSAGTWTAAIRLNGRHQHIGSFATVEEAAAARAKAEAESGAFHANHGKRATHRKEP